MPDAHQCVSTSLAPAGPIGDCLSVTTVRSPSDIRRAAEALRDIARELGDFRVAPCANIASKMAMSDSDGAILASEVFEWPSTDEQWWRRPQIALDSPLTIACRYESDPFWANNEGFRARVDNPMLERIDMSQFDEFVTEKAVICVPVYMPFGQIGVVSFSPRGNDRTDLSHEFEHYGERLEFHARRFINSYVKVTSDRPWIPSDCRLSDREIVCLRWAAVGKTDAEIAMIIHRSCATVRFHIHNARVKLDAVNRSQTVFKAAQLGYLGSAAVSSSLPHQGAH